MNGSAMSLDARDPAQAGTTTSSSSAAVIVCSVGTAFIEREWRCRWWAMDGGRGSFEVDADDGLALL